MATQRENFTSSDDWTDVWRTTLATGYYCAQIFTAASDHNVTSIKIKAFRIGTIGNLTLSIRATSGGLPTGSDLASGNIDVSALTTSSTGAVIEATMGTPCNLTSGVVYAIVVKGDWTPSTSNNCPWRCLNAGSIANGNVGSADGSSWSVRDASREAYFEIWGEDTVVNITVSPDAVVGTFSLPASTVTAIQNITASPAELVATFSAQAPAITGTAVVSADVVSGTFSLPAPDIILPDAYVTPDAVVGTLSIPEPTVTAIENVSVSTDLLNGTLSLPTATVVIAVSVVPDALTAVLTLPEVTITAIGNVTVSPNALTGTFSIPSSTVEAIQHITVSPDAVSAAFSLPSPTITALRTVVVSADVLTGVLSMPAMVITADQWQPQYSQVSSTPWSAQYGGGSASWDNKY